jgi:hypothetical protein
MCRSRNQHGSLVVNDLRLLASKLIVRTGDLNVDAPADSVRRKGVETGWYENVDSVCDRRIHGVFGGGQTAHRISIVRGHVECGKRKRCWWLRES